MVDQLHRPPRYSPKPLSAYHRPGEQVGPAFDLRVSNQEIWNLAYLSFDYDSHALHPDPFFLTHVRRSCQFSLGRRKVVLQGVRDDDSIKPLLRNPAPAFVAWLKANMAVTVELPLFRSYGSEWLALVEERSWLCQTDDHQEIEIKNLEAARSLLARFRQGA